MEHFDEKWYLEQYPDVAPAVESGRCKSAYEHFQSVGRAEARSPIAPHLAEQWDRADQELNGYLFWVDELLVTLQGACLLLGWIDERGDPLTELVALPYAGDPIDLRPCLHRYSRQDVREHVRATPDNFDFGIWIAFDNLPHPLFEARLRIAFASGRGIEVPLSRRVVPPIDLRWRILGAINLRPHGSAEPSLLDDGVGPILRKLNRLILERTTISAPRRYGKPGQEPALSIVVPLSRGVEDARRQVAFLAAAPGIGQIEVVYAGGPPLSDFHVFAECAHEMYGISPVVVAASEEPGSARACNEAARAATGRTLLFLDPAVLPCDDAWLERALRLGAEIGERDIVGGRLLNEDDSLRQYGLAFKAVEGPSRLWRVLERVQERPISGSLSVAAVGAAAMLVRRSFFWELGGFDEDFVLRGGYQDGDLCFRARAAGGEVKIDSGLVFYYVEAPAAPALPEETAATLVNRALFGERWNGMLDAGREAAANPGDGLHDNRFGDAGAGLQIRDLTAG